MTNADIETLWHEHHRRIYGYMVNQVGDADVIDDLVQSVYLRVVVAIRNGNGYVSNAFAWLCAIARSVINDFWRAKRHVTLSAWDDLTDSPCDAPTLDEQVNEILRRDSLYRAIDALPTEAQKDAVILRLQGYAHGEIAAIFDTAEQAAKQVGVRAYANLRQRLQEAA